MDWTDLTKAIYAKVTNSINGTDSDPKKEDGIAQETLTETDAVLRVIGEDLRRKSLQHPSDGPLIGLTSDERNIIGDPTYDRKNVSLAQLGEKVQEVISLHRQVYPKGLDGKPIPEEHVLMALKRNMFVPQADAADRAYRQSKGQHAQ